MCFFAVVKSKFCQKEMEELLVHVCPGLDTATKIARFNPRHTYKLTARVKWKGVSDYTS